MIEKRLLKANSSILELWKDGEYLGVFNTSKLADEYLAKLPKEVKSESTAVTSEPVKIEKPRRGRPKK